MLDSSVKHISRVACMALSGTIENGLMLSSNYSAQIVIYKDRIDFGECYNPDFQGVSGLLFPNFYMEYGNVIYRYGCNLSCSFWGKTIDYVGAFAPTSPDNEQIYNLIYPRFS